MKVYQDLFPPSNTNAMLKALSASFSVESNQLEQSASSMSYCSSLLNRLFVSQPDQSDTVDIVYLPTQSEI